jgi:hypothetical protein
MSLRRSLSICGCLVVAVILCWCAWQVWTLHRYGSRSRAIREAINSLRHRRPVNISERAWEEGVGWTITAHVNVCLSPGHTSYEAMDRYGRDLDEKLNGAVDADTLDWIWDRLAETGPHGKSYTTRFRSDMKMSMN